MQYQIETELKSLPDLCQLLESVYTAKDFLMEAGGQHDLSLAKFLVSIKFDKWWITCKSQYNISIFRQNLYIFTTETYPAQQTVAPSDTYSWLM